MKQNIKAIPNGYHTLTPYLTLKDASKAIKFYKEAFGAKEIELHKTEEGKIMNAVIKIGNSFVMLSDEFLDSGCGISTPQSLRGTTAMLHLYVEDVDTVFHKAIKSGAKVKKPVEDMPWGDRYGQLEDPFGHLWSIATHTTDLTPEEIEQSRRESFLNLNLSMLN